MASQIEQDIYTRFASVASSMGYNEVHGRIIAALLVSEKPMALNEIANRTGYSISSISISLDLLEVVGLIKKSKKPGDRKIYAVIEGDLLDGVRKAFLLKLQKEILTAVMQFSQYKTNDPKTKKVISKLEKEIDRLSRYVDALSKIEIPK